MNVADDKDVPSRHSSETNPPDLEKGEIRTGREEDSIEDNVSLLHSIFRA